MAASASTAFAAANPFEDVPEGHWAYDAVAQLAADGVIEGYGDGTYRGDPKITRFEMAKMIARAMANGGGDRATLDKLAAEFADELNSLGVRVANLEKKVDNMTWKGQLRYRYHNEWEIDEGVSTRYAHSFVTLRLEPSMRVNEHWSGHARIDFNSNMNSAANTPAAHMTYTKRHLESDIEYNGMKALTRALAPGELHADLLKFPHHAVNGVDGEFLMAVDPRLCIVTNRDRNTPGEQGLRVRHMPYVCTRYGGLVCTTDGTRWLVERLIPNWRGHLPRPLKAS